MVNNGGNTEGLFRAVCKPNFFHFPANLELTLLCSPVAQSGSPSPSGPITDGQPYYDNIVEDVGCSASSDTLECLRQAPYANLTAAIDATPGLFEYQSLNNAWLPRVDGVFITDNPQILIAEGKYAKVPLITTDCDDEGQAYFLSHLAGK